MTGAAPALTRAKAAGQRPGPAVAARSRRRPAARCPSPTIEIGSRATNAAEEKRRPPGVASRSRYGVSTGGTVRDAGPTPRGPEPPCEDHRVSDADARAVRRLAAGVLRRSRGTGRRAAVPGERHPRPGHPARAAARGGRALPRPSAGSAPSTRRTARWSPRSRPTSRRTASTCRSTGATATGRRTSPTTLARIADDGRAPGARPAHVGLLVVLRVPAVPREPRRCRGARSATGPRTSTGSGTTSTTPASSAAMVRGDRRGRRRAAGRRSRRCAAGLRHALDPDVDGREQRPGRRRVQHPAPRRRPAGHRGGRGRDRGRPRARPRLLQPQRAARPAVARAGRQRPPRGAGRPTASRRSCWCRSASSRTTWR